MAAVCVSSLRPVSAAAIVLILCHDSHFQNTEAGSLSTEREGRGRSGGGEGGETERAAGTNISKLHAVNIPENIRVSMATGVF